MSLRGTSSFGPQEYFVTKFSKAVFPLSNLVAPFRKPAWKDGSTATCVLAVDNILYIANLGDSRVSGTEKPAAGVSVPLQASLVLQGDICCLPYCWRASDTGETLQSLRAPCWKDDSYLSVLKLSFVLECREPELTALSQEALPAVLLLFTHAGLSSAQAILCRYNEESQKHTALSLSKEHNPTQYEERMRIQKAGGNVR